MINNAHKNLKTIEARMSIEYYSFCYKCGNIVVIDHYYDINEIEDYKETHSCCGEKFIVSIKRPTLLNPKTTKEIE